MTLTPCYTFNCTQNILLPSHHVLKPIAWLSKEITIKSEAFLSTKKEINKLEKTLKNQLHYQSQHIMSKRFTPVQYLQCQEPSMTAKFKQEYETLFFNHLSATIVANKVALNIKKAKLTSTIKETENILIASKASTECIQDCYKKFKAIFISPDYQPNPSLGIKMSQITATLAKQTTTPPLSKQNLPSYTSNTRKRKNTSSHPKGSKHRKTIPVKTTPPITSYFYR